MLLIPFSIEPSYSAGESPRSPGPVSGSVYYSNDGLAKIYEGTNWSCINITAYCIEEYGSGIVDLAVDKGKPVDNGSAHPDEFYDDFKFDPHYLWANESTEKEHITVGENKINGSCYVFITSFFYNNTPSMGPQGLCKDTEWEPIPKPIAYKRGASWVNISIPKFENKTNIENTMGFAVYRDETNNSWTLDKNYLKVGNATYSADGYYYFNDTNLSHKTTYYYAVAPIARGGYIIYCKSPGVEISTTMPLVTINSPKGGEDWSGNTSHTVSYTIQSGEPPFIVNLSYSIDGINWIWFNTTICDKLGTYIYNWITPSIDSKAVRIGINVTDNGSVTDFDTSDDNFTIDSTPPQIKAYPVETAPLLTNFTIEFDESVNRNSVKEAFSYSNETTTWTCANGTVIWYYKDTVMVFDPDVNFTEKMQYNCTISKLAKDDSDSGNHLLENYTWSFVAKPGRGNFSVAVEYPPSSVYETDWCQIKVTVTNGVAPDAYNKSAPLLVEFFRSSAGENFTEPFYATTIGGMYPNGSGVAYANFTFPSSSTWYLKVRITVQSPVDVINGGKSYEDVSKAIEVNPSPRPAPEKEIGPGPYVLIALIVVIAIVVALWIIASYRKGARKKRPRYRKEIKKKRL